MAYDTGPFLRMSALAQLLQQQSSASEALCAPEFDRLIGAQAILRLHRQFSNKPPNLSCNFLYTLSIASRLVRGAMLRTSENQSVCRANVWLMSVVYGRCLPELAIRIQEVSEADTWTLQISSVSYRDLYSFTMKIWSQLRNIASSDTTLRLMGRTQRAEQNNLSC